MSFFDLFFNKTNDYVEEVLPNTSIKSEEISSEVIEACKNDIINRIYEEVSEKNKRKEENINSADVEEIVINYEDNGAERFINIPKFSVEIKTSSIVGIKIKQEGNSAVIRDVPVCVSSFRESGLVKISNFYINYRYYEDIFKKHSIDLFEVENKVLFEVEDYINSLPEDELQIKHTVREETKGIIEIFLSSGEIINIPTHHTQTKETYDKLVNIWKGVI